MILRQFLHTDPVVAASYLVGCGGRAVGAVIDPVTDPEVYLDAAQATGLTLRYVIDTHVHADVPPRPARSGETRAHNLGQPAGAAAPA